MTGDAMSFRLPEQALVELEARVQEALVSGHAGTLDVLGYGEVSTVLRLKSDGGEFACKRLPPFQQRGAFDDYSRCLTMYIDRLRERGLTVAPTQLWSTPRADGTIAAYCVQPVYPSGEVGNRYLAGRPVEEVYGFFDRILKLIVACSASNTGLDAQLSNWVFHAGQVIYLDISTPLMRDAAGNELLDMRLFIRSLPAALREPVRRFALKGIIDKFYTPRGTVLDFLGNLIKERMENALPGLLERANAVVSPALTEKEVRAYYKDDATTWALLQKLRRTDRWWQRSVRRRAYGFLLPAKVDRNL